MKKGKNIQKSCITIEEKLKWIFSYSIKEDRNQRSNKTKFYSKPTMKLLKDQHQSKLLRITMDSYTLKGGPGEWEKMRKREKDALEWFLLGTMLLRCWQSISNTAPLLANRIQAVEPHTAHSVQAVAPLLVHYIGTVPCRWPKHKKNEGSSQKKDRSRKIRLNWVWKQSIKDRNDSDLNRFGNFKPK